MPVRNQRTQPLRAVIYARYSSDEQRPESIEDQIESCRQYCERMGWTIVATYADAAMSGASAARPEYERMRRDADRRAFDVVVAEALDRLSRRVADVAGLHDRLAFLGVKLHTTDRGEITPLLAGVLGAVAQSYLEDLRHKTRRGLRGKVLAGLSAGGIGYGYRADPATPDKRIIDTEEAAVVRRIFTLYADGVSPRTIAAKLNAGGVPGPGGRPWGDTTIRGQVARGTGLLNNAAYVGRIEWDRCSYVKDPVTGKRQARPKPPEEWEVVEAPELRIIDDETWARVKARQGEVRTEMGRDEDGNALNRAHRNRYILSGLLYCGCCGSPYVMVDGYRYGCAQNRSKGTCPNDTKLKRADLETRVADALRHRLMAPEAVGLALNRVQEQHEQDAGQAEAKRAALGAKLRRLDSQIDKLTDAIAAAGHSTALLAKLANLEAEKVKVAAEINDLDTAAGVPLPPLSAGHVMAVYHALIKDLLLLLTPEATSDKEEQLAPLRDMLRGMIERITVQPAQDGEAVILFEGSFTGILAAAGLAQPIENKSPLAGGQGAFTVGGCGGLHCLRGNMSWMTRFFAANA
ncbi:recombinase family protein [Caenispirillum bisanense]|uniref:recombinase family protein n=1 Tax=Caenispirillum bisanense TaxID=414052 RepID=UPI0031E00F29